MRYRVTHAIRMLHPARAGCKRSTPRAPGEEGDNTLREIAEGDASERLRQIKALVCD